MHEESMLETDAASSTSSDSSSYFCSSSSAAAATITEKLDAKTRLVVVINGELGVYNITIKTTPSSIASSRSSLSSIELRPMNN